MMKKNIIILFGFIFLLNSCNQDLLDIEQHGALSPEIYYSEATDGQAEQLIASVYRSVYGDFNWYGFWNGMSDNGAGSQSNYSINVTSQDHGGSSYYTSLYRLNYLCNMIIENMPADTDVKKQVHGEAYFWRAWANMYLVRLFGTPPLVDHVLGVDELTPSNATESELWAYVESSLDEAINLLPEKIALGQQSAIGGRVTLHSVYALLGKVQVIKGDYGDAVTTLERVINSGKYALQEDYRELYHITADFSDEYMWEFNIDDADQSNFERQGDSRAINLTWRTENVTVPGGLTAQGYGGADLNKDFYDFMVARGEKGLPRYLGTIWDYEDIQDRFVELELAADRTEAIGKFWGTEPIMQNCQGYFRAKMLPWESDLFDYLVTQNIHSKANWPGMRYAEVLLLHAEACIQANTHLTEGLASMNEVRERAGFTTTLGTYTLQNVKDEKRAELAYEGERFLDLVRWGDAASELADRGFFTYQFSGYVDGTTDYSLVETPVQDAAGFTSGRDELFPIPYNEMLLNDNLVQNPNW